MVVALELSTTVVADTVVVAVAGEVDIATSPELSQALTAATQLHGQAGLLCCDLAGVTLLDSTGLGALAKARVEAYDRGLEFCVSGATGAVAKVLRLTALDQVFTVYESVQAAFAARSSDPDARAGA